MRVVLYDWETIAVSNAFVGATWVHLHRWRSFAPHVVQTLWATYLTRTSDPENDRQCLTLAIMWQVLLSSVWMRAVSREREKVPTSGARTARAKVNNPSTNLPYAVCN